MGVVGRTPTPSFFRAPIVLAILIISDDFPRFPRSSLPPPSVFPLTLVRSLSPLFVSLFDPTLASPCHLCPTSMYFVRNIARRGRCREGGTCFLTSHDKRGAWMKQSTGRRGGSRGAQRRGISCSRAKGRCRRTQTEGRRERRRQTSTTGVSSSSNET